MKQKVFDLWQSARWRLLVFRQAMAQVSVALVICALVAGLYKSRAHFMFACCAAAALLLAAAWFSFCRWRDGKPARRDAQAVPYILRWNKGRRGHRPAFLMDSADFDDDLTPFTMSSEEDFSESECLVARAAAQALAAAVMLVVSFAAL